jgi:hypothetical protein
MTRPNSVAVDVPSDVEPPRPLASWYAQGSSDGIGDRLLMFDNTGTPSLELLRFRPELAAAPGFEDALRERVERLQGFTHPCFPHARAVERLDGGAGLTLVSTFTAGKRLAEIFRSPRARTGVHPAFAAWLIRDLTAALADLQRQGDGIAHGGLTPDRIVLTADGHLVIAEHVLGGALDRLRLPAARLWQDLGLIAPESPNGTALLDDRTDVIQLGWIVLSVLLGRRITPAEYPQHADALLDEFARTSGRRSPALIPALRCWLERALRLDGDVFESAMEAQDAIRELGIHGGPHAIEYMARSQPAIALVHDAAPEIAATASAAPQLDEPQPGEGEPPPYFSELETQPMTMVTEYVADLQDGRPSGDTSSISGVGRRLGRRVTAAWAVAAVFALCALVEGLVLARLAARTPVASPAVVPITFESPEPGDPVIIDGRQVGVTPLEVKLTPGMRSVRVQSRPAAPAVLNASLAQPIVDRPADAATAAVIAQAGARERRGGLRLSAPVEVQVLEGERVLGSSADGPIVTTAGRHELDFINSAIGYRARRVVEIRAGQIVKMTVAPPDGRVSVNAIPWAQVWINGNLVGDTPIANLPLAVGEHQITFRHPQLGEQIQKVVVRSSALTRVSATFAR